MPDAARLLIFPLWLGAAGWVFFDIHHQLRAFTPEAQKLAKQIVYVARCRWAFLFLALALHVVFLILYVAWYRWRYIADLRGLRESSERYPFPTFTPKGQEDPYAREKRLLMHTDDSDPVVRCVIQGGLSSKQGTNAAIFSDFYFTDYGVFVARYSSFQLPMNSLVVGFIGGLVGVLGDAAISSTERAAARRKYEKRRAEKPDLSVATLFAVAGRVAFLPDADFFPFNEIEELTTDNGISFAARGKDWTCACEDSLSDRRHRDQLKQFAITWDARRHENNRNG